MILYPSTSLRHVAPVTRGARVACFFWLQSMLGEDAKRTILFDLDISIQRLSTPAGLGDPAIVSPTGAHHDLLGAWAAIWGGRFVHELGSTA